MSPREIPPAFRESWAAHDLGDGASVFALDDEGTVVYDGPERRRVDPMSEAERRYIDERLGRYDDKPTRRGRALGCAGVGCYGLVWVALTLGCAYFIAHVLVAAGVGR